MQKKDSNFLDKIVKKNYKNELEAVLEHKFFDATAKGLLLEILYKVEAGYKDYRNVKKDSLSKEEYIEEFIKNIKENCKTIKIIKPNSSMSSLLGNRTFIVNKRKNEIKCFPVARKLLYSVSKISKKDKIVKDKYFLINETLSNLVNVGDNINTVEPLRDFNGWSWTTVPREIENIKYNLIYQIMLITVGMPFMRAWIENKEYIIDYLEELKNRLESNYGKKLQKEFIDKLEKLSILMELKVSKESEEKILALKHELEEKLNKFGNKKEYLQELTEEKNRLKNRIKEIDTTINNKEMLAEEYEKRNENLPLEKKIFSIRILTEMLTNEREETLERLEEINELIKPKNFINKQEELEKELKPLEIVAIEDRDAEIKKELLSFQKIFLEMLKVKIKKAETKQEIIDLIYRFRYYCLIPCNQKDNVFNLKEIQSKLNETGKALTEKAIELKAIARFAEDADLNYMITKNIFCTRIIELEELYIKLIKEKDQYFVQIFDEKIFEEKQRLNINEKINKKDLKIRPNRKIKLFE